jgi:hypothetical protein
MASPCILSIGLSWSTNGTPVADSEKTIELLAEDGEVIQPLYFGDIMGDILHDLYLR